MRRIIAGVVVVAVIVTVYLWSSRTREEPRWTPIESTSPLRSASAVTPVSPTTTSAASVATSRRPTTAPATATAPTTAVRDPMYKALTSHFIPYEAERLTDLYLSVREALQIQALPAELRDRLPPSAVTVATVRAQVKDIVGDAGYARLMELSDIPKHLLTDLERMEYTFGHPLVFWSILKE